MHEALLWKSYYRLVYDNQAEYDDAIAFLSNVIAKQPDNAIAFNNRGVAYAETGRKAEALADFLRAVQLALDGDHIPAENLAELQQATD